MARTYWVGNTEVVENDGIPHADQHAVGGADSLSALYVALAGSTSTGEQVALDFKATGKTGATATPQILAGGTAAGPPTSGAHVKGEIVTDDTGIAWFCTTAGSPGTWTQINWAANKTLRSTTYLAESISRVGTNNRSPLSTGRLHMQLIYLPAGMTVTNITWSSATTPLGSGSNQWFALFDSSRNKLGVTSDDTSTAWAANTVKTLALAQAYPVTTSGLYYVGICVVAGQMPTIGGVAQLSNLAASVPILVGSADSSLTNPASCPNPASAIAAGTDALWCAVS